MAPTTSPTLIPKPIVIMEGDTHAMAKTAGARAFVAGGTVPAPAPLTVQPDVISAGGAVDLSQIREPVHPLEQARRDALAGDDQALARLLKAAHLGGAQDYAQHAAATKARKADKKRKRIATGKTRRANRSR